MARGVRIPIQVDGVEVFDDQEWLACDNPDFKGGCFVGFRVNRLEGRDTTGAPIPEVVWVYLCRSVGMELFEKGTVSVQMIGHNARTGATAFFEAPDANPSRPNSQPDLCRFDEHGVLTGQLPGPGDSDFDDAFISQPIQCTHCHQADPFIHDPWIDGARLALDPSRPVIPELGRPDSLYYVVGARTGTAARSISRATAAPPATVRQIRTGFSLTARTISTTSCLRTTQAAWRRTTPRSARATTRVRKQLPGATGSSRRHADTPASGAAERPKQ